MTQDLFSILEEKPATGKELATIGMNKAVNHADQVNDKWNKQCFALLKKFIYEKVQNRFMTEDFRGYATRYGLKEPPSDRAYGAIIRMAASERLIKLVGYGHVKNPKAHSANAAIWEVI